MRRLDEEERLQRVCEEVFACGYSLQQHFDDRGYSNVTAVYAEKQFDDLTRLLLLDLKVNGGNGERRFVSDKKFVFPFCTKTYFSSIEFIPLDACDFKKGDTVFIIKPSVDPELEAYFKGLGVRVLQAAKEIPKMLKWALYIRPLLYFRHVHLDVLIGTLQLPSFPKTDYSPYEQGILDEKRSVAKIIKSLQQNEGADEGAAVGLSEFGYSEQDALDILSVPDSFYDVGGVRRYADKRGRVTIAGGHRVTLGQPEDAKRNIFLVGNEAVFGVGAPDEYTIASQLQLLLDIEQEQDGIAVWNYGSFLVSHLEDMHKILQSLPVSPGDIVLAPAPATRLFPHINLSGLFQRPHGYGEVFIDKITYNQRGHGQIAGKLFEELEGKGFFNGARSADYPDMPITAKRSFAIPEVACYTQPEALETPPVTPEAPKALAPSPLGPVDLKALKGYRILLEKTRELTIGPIGSIVMNCDPFTLGHRFLVEYAASRVKYLYIFLVEGTGSFFPFKDRFDLVVAGIADLPNVTVLPSGPFVVSSPTFSDCLDEEEIQARIGDSLQDLELFGREIAPVLNISARFAGGEPSDVIADQYNNAMRQILAQYDIAFEVVPRKEVDGAPISAGKVRELLTSQDYKEIARLVPKTTFEYLKKESLELLAYDIFNTLETDRI